MKTRRINTHQLFSNLCIIVFTLIITICPAYADTGDQIVSSINSGLGNIYRTITAIALPIAAVVLVVSAVRMLINSDSTRGAEMMKHTVVVLIVALAIVYMAPLLIKTISGWFSAYSDTSGIFN